MKSTPLAQILAVAHRHLDELRRSEMENHNDILAELMLDTYELGKTLRASPECLSDAGVRRFMDETISVIKAQHVDLSFYPWTIERRFDGIWEGNEWEQLCIVRSGLQFFLDLFRETALAEHVAAVETDDVDEFIRKRGHEGYLSDDKIPPELPASHWWWWYPEEPRRPR